MKLHLTASIVVLLCALLGTPPLFADKMRSAEPVTFANQTMALTIAPDGKVSLKRDDPLNPTAVISAHRYTSEFFRAYITGLPAGKSTSVEIINIEAMKEDRNTGLIDPILILNDAKSAVKGTIPYNHYLVYAGGTIAKVYSPNWKFVKDLPVTVEGDLKAIKGNNTFSVSAPQSPNAWLSSRIKVADTVNRITIQKPKGTR